RTTRPTRTATASTPCPAASGSTSRAPTTTSGSPSRRKPRRRSERRRTMKLRKWTKSSVAITVSAAFLSATTLSPLVGCAAREAENAAAQGQRIGEVDTTATTDDGAIATTADGAKMYSWNGFDINVYPNGDAHAVYTYDDGSTLQAKVFAGAPDGNLGSARI